MPLYALIGYPLSHSFSKKYFTEKFERLNIRDSRYELHPLDAIEAFPVLVASLPELKGMNVTLPYKEAVMAYLDEIDPAAAEVGAVNTILFQKNKTKGYNTDVYGFEQSLLNFFGKVGKGKPEKALVFGTGGAAKAVWYVLNKLNIEYKTVSRTPGKGDLTYQDLKLGREYMDAYRLLINTTPLGMSPKIESCPDIPYEHLNDTHFLYDLVYNPEKTLFLKMGQNAGSAICNGLEMLYLQAEKAWEIWTSEI
ncbi:MAG: shikimate dehydrogenase [Bacteroidota bacterium]